MASSTALFLDGPLQGTVRDFDRPEPPSRIYHTASECSPDDPLDPPRRFLTFDYERDLNPFDNNPPWVYMLALPQKKES